MSHVADALRKAQPDAAAAIPFDEEDHPWNGGPGSRPVDPDAAFRRHVEMRRHGPRVRDDAAADARRVAGGDATRIAAPASALAAFDPSVRQQLEALVERVFLLPVTKAPHAVGFAGIDTDTGTAAIAAAVAEILAQQTPASVCIVDAHVTAGSVHECFGLPREPGLTEALESNPPVASTATHVQGGLWAITAGERATGSIWNAASLARMSHLVGAFDHVVLHLEPLARSTAGLVSLLDGIVLVVAAESTRRDLGRQLAATLKESGATLLGAVLTNRRDVIPDAIYRRL